MRQKVVPRANREAIAGFIRPPLQLGLVKPGTDFRHEVLGAKALPPGDYNYRIVTPHGETTCSLTVVIEIRSGQDVFASETITPQYVDSYPNGKECDITPVRKAKASIKVSIS